MNLRKLKLIQDGAVPLYYLPNGARYKYTDFKTDSTTYNFVKHHDYKFPECFRFQRKDLVCYQYEVGIPQSTGSKAIFVEETSIVTLLKIK